MEVVYAIDLCILIKHHDPASTKKMANDIFNAVNDVNLYL